MTLCVERQGDHGGAVIIGSGQKVIDRIPAAGGQAGIDVAVTVIGIPAHVERYATFAY